MSDVTYRSGSWFAVVGPRAVVFLDDSVPPSRLQAVWDTGTGTPTLDELIEVVTGGRFVGAPFFGLALVESTGLRVVVRAGVVAVVGESIGAARTVVSGTANTWVEESLDQVQSVRFVRDSEPSTGLSLPLTGGIVRADEITWTPSPTALTGRSGSLTAVPSEPRFAVEQPDSRFRAGPTGLVPEAAPAAPVAGDPNDSEWSVWALDDAGELAGGADENVEADSWSASGERGDRVERVTVQPGTDLPPLLAPVIPPEPGYEPPVGLPPLLPEAQPESPFEPPVELAADEHNAERHHPEQHNSGWENAGWENESPAEPDAGAPNWDQLVRESPAADEPARNAPDWDELAREHQLLESRHAVIQSSGGQNSANETWDDGEWEDDPNRPDLTRADLPPVPAGWDEPVTPGLGTLQFSTGQVVPLEGTVIVGRAPSVDALQRADNPQTFRLDNVGQDISRNHVEVAVHDGQVLVTDLNSSNGTVVTLPGRPGQRLIPGEPFMLLPGSTVALSEEAYFSFESAE
jgi:resuscitation-promoting factor RpfA